jgi:hypothetical protein
MFLTAAQRLKLKGTKTTKPPKVNPTAKSTTAKAREKIIASAPAPVIEPITTAEAGSVL